MQQYGAAYGAYGDPHVSPQFQNPTRVRRFFYRPGPPLGGLEPKRSEKAGFWWLSPHAQPAPCAASPRRLAGRRGSSAAALRGAACRRRLPARCRPTLRPAPPPAQVVHLRNLPFDITIEEIRELCAPWGTVMAVKDKVGGLLAHLPPALPRCLSICRPPHT